MNALIDLTGETFGHLHVIKPYPRKMRNRVSHWLCRCDCGKLVVVRSDNLRTGRSTQCSLCHGRGFTSIFIEDGEINEFV